MSDSTRSIWIPNGPHKPLYFGSNQSSQLLLTEDGVTHINIHDVDATTELGQALGVSRMMPFTHPVLGYFSRMQNFWHWIKTLGSAPEELRVARTYGEVRDLNCPSLDVREFYSLVLEGYYYLIVQNDLSKAFIDSKLPFKCYRVLGNTREELTAMSFLCSGLESLREIMLDGYTPRPINYDNDFEGFNRVYRARVRARTD